MYKRQLVNNPKKNIPWTCPYAVACSFVATFRFLPSNIYILLSTFLFVTSPVSGFIVTTAFSSTPLLSTKLSNFFNRFAPLHKYNTELFFNFTWSTLLNEKNTAEYSFVLSVAPDNDIAELLIVAQSALCIDILLWGLSTVT